MKNVKHCHWLSVLQSCLAVSFSLGRVVHVLFDVGRVTAGVLWQCLTSCLVRVIEPWSLQHPSCEGSGRDVELLLLSVISYHLHVAPVSPQTVVLYLMFLIAPLPTSETEQATKLSSIRVIKP